LPVGPLRCFFLQMLEFSISRRKQHSTSEAVLRLAKLYYSPLPFTLR
jgi:hypothetical protein